MKRLIIAILCLLLIGFSACKQVVPLGKTTSTTLEQTTQGIESITVYITVPTTVIGDITNNTSTPSKDPYSSIVKGHYDFAKNNPNVNEYHYCLYDIDGNGTKELLLGFKGWGPVEIYTIQDGTAVRQEGFFSDFESAPTPLLYKNGTIRTCSHRRLSKVCKCEI